MGYTFEQRKKAVELNIEYGKGVSAVCSKLGYSSRQAMCDWYAGYVEHGFPLDHRPHRKFIDEQKCTVIYKRKWGFLGMGEIGSFSDLDLFGDPHAAQIRLVGAVMVEAAEDWSTRRCMATIDVEARLRAEWLALVAMGTSGMGPKWSSRATMLVF